LPVVVARPRLTIPARPIERPVDLLERAAQLATLRAHGEAVVQSGQGRLVVVGGEAGGGKTTLVRRFSAAASGRAAVFTVPARRCSRLSAAVTIP
jgi:Flp pilus assembly CpaF family ATPase